MGSATHLRSLRPLRRHHHPCIIPQHIQPLLLGQELLRRSLNRRQIAQIQLQPCESTLRVGQVFCDAFDGVQAFLFGPASEVDGCVRAVEDLAELVAAACVAACYYEDLFCFGFC